MPVDVGDLQRSLGGGGLGHARPAQLAASQLAAMAAVECMSQRPECAGGSEPARDQIEAEGCRPDDAYPVRAYCAARRARQLLHICVEIRSPFSLKERSCGPARNAFSSRAPAIGSLFAPFDHQRAAMARAMPCRDMSWPECSLDEAEIRPSSLL